MKDATVQSSEDCWIETSQLGGCRVSRDGAVAWNVITMLTASKSCVPKLNELRDLVGWFQGRH